MNTSAVSEETSNDKSATALLGGLNTSPANINFIRSHSTFVKPRDVILTDSLISFTKRRLKAAYNGLVFVSSPYYASTSGHHTNGDLPNKSWSIPADIF